MFLTFTPTDGLKQFRFNSKQLDGSVSLVTCTDQCHVQVTDECGAALLRDYSFIFAEGKGQLPRKSKKADVKEIPGGIEPTADKMANAPDETKSDFDEVNDGSAPVMAETE